MLIGKLFRFLCVLLVALFFVGALPWREIRADANIHGDYNCDRLSVTYDQTSSWDFNTQGEFVITNVSEETVEGWTLHFEFAVDLTITNLWNGQDLRNETTPANILIIGNEAYNGTIAPGESVSFGLIMTGYEFAPVAPLNATLPVAAEPVPEEIPAEPEVIPAVDPSTCVIFAGSDVTISGWRTTIEGNIYAGNSFNFQGSELSVAGTVNSEGTVTITGYSSVVSGTQEGAAHVDMPNLSEEILSDAYDNNSLPVLFIGLFNDVEYFNLDGSSFYTCDYHWVNVLGYETDEIEHETYLYVATWGGVKIIKLSDVIDLGGEMLYVEFET